MGSWSRGGVSSGRLHGFPPETPPPIDERGAFQNHLESVTYVPGLKCYPSPRSYSRPPGVETPGYRGLAPPGRLPRPDPSLCSGPQAKPDEQLLASRSFKARRRIRWRPAENENSPQNFKVRRRFLWRPIDFDGGVENLATAHRF